MNLLASAPPTAWSRCSPRAAGPASSSGSTPPTPVPPFIPVIMFAVAVRPLDGLRGVPALARARGVPAAAATPRSAVTEGLTRTARVITAAAAIMVAVFGSLALEPGGLPQADRPRPGDGGARRRDDRAARAGARGDAAARRAQLVDAALAGPRDPARRAGGPGDRLGHRTGQRGGGSERVRTCPVASPPSPAPPTPTARPCSPAGSARWSSSSRSPERSAATSRSTTARPARSPRPPRRCSSSDFAGRSPETVDVVWETQGADAAQGRRVPAQGGDAEGDRRPRRRPRTRRSRRTGRSRSRGCS